MSKAVDIADELRTPQCRAIALWSQAQVGPFNRWVAEGATGKPWLAYAPGSVRRPRMAVCALGAKPDKCPPGNEWNAAPAAWSR